MRMEEGERVCGQAEGEKEGVGEEETEGAISGFATCLAASLLKETMKEKQGSLPVQILTMRKRVRKQRQLDLHLLQAPPQLLPRTLQALGVLDLRALRNQVFPHFVV